MIHSMCRDFSSNSIVAIKLRIFKMKFIFITIFAMFVGSSYSSKTEMKCQIEEKIKVDECEEVEIHLIDLSDDILYKILYYLELQDLLHASESMPQRANITDEVFQRKYLKNEPLVRVYVHIRHAGHAVKFFDNEITIYGHSYGKRVFKQFGGFLKNIKVHYDTFVDNFPAEIINRFLNRYCSESLKRLQLDYWSDLIDLSDFEIPFKNVDELIVTASVALKEITAPKSMNELFPNLHRINLKFEKDSNISFIDGQFVLIDHFHLTVRYIDDAKRPEMIEQLKEFIIKNPSIRSIEISLDYSPNFLKFLSKTLLDLESLNINPLRIDDNDTVQFEKVKTLVIDKSVESNQKNLDKIALPRLETFKTSFFPSCFYELKEFFRRHTQFKQLHFIKFLTSLDSDPGLNELLADLTELVDLRINLYSYSGIEQITGFIRSNQQCEKIRLEFPVGFKVTEVAALKQQFQNEWKVKGTKKNGRFIRGISFDRRQRI